MQLSEPPPGPARPGEHVLPVDGALVVDLERLPRLGELDAAALVRRPAAIAVVGLEHERRLVPLGHEHAVVPADVDGRRGLWRPPAEDHDGRAVHEHLGHRPAAVPRPGHDGPAERQPVRDGEVVGVGQHRGGAVAVVGLGQVADWAAALDRVDDAPGGPDGRLEVQGHGDLTGSASVCGTSHGPSKLKQHKHVSHLFMQLCSLPTL